MLMVMEATCCRLNLVPGAEKNRRDFLKQSCKASFNSRAVFLNALGGFRNGTNSEQKILHYISGTEVRQKNCGPLVLVNGKADHSDITEKQEEDISRTTLIWRAIKLPIYSVALIPLTVGGAAAYFQTSVFSIRRYFVLLASSVLVITWLNLSNDVYDFDTGADKNKRESVVKLVGHRTWTLVMGYILLAIGFIGLTWASIQSGHIRPVLLLACAVLCGYIYQSPPFRLSYQGLGEPLCFAAFGPFATTAFCMLQSCTSEGNYVSVSSTILSASILVGFTTTLILFCSHFHQVEEDKAVGKISPLVRLGTKKGSEVVKVAVITLYASLYAAGLIKCLPLSCIFLCSLTLPLAKVVVNFVEANHENKQKIFMAKYYCVRLHSLFGATLAAGLVAARTMTSR